MGHRVAAVSIVASAVLATTHLSAQPGPPPTPAIQLLYRADPGCPREDAFLRQLAARTSRFRRAAPGETVTLRLRVTLRATGEAEAAYRGTLVVQENDASPAERQLHGAECAQVAAALAVVIAVGLDTSTLAPSPAPEEPMPPLGPELLRPGPRPRAEPFVELSRVLAGSGPGWRLAFVLGGGLSSALDTATGHGEIGLDLRAVGSELFSPSFRFALGGVAPRHGALTFEDGGAQVTTEGDFQLLTARAAACPLRLGGDTLLVEPCVALQVGMIRSVGATTPGAGFTKLTPWVAPEVELRVRWAVADPLFVELAGGLFVPLLRSRHGFTSGDAGVIVQPPLLAVPPAGGRGLAGIGVYFW